MYCEAIRSGGPKEWDFLHERFMQSGAPHEQEDILESLGCVGQQRRLEHDSLVARLMRSRSYVRNKYQRRSQVVYERTAGNKGGPPILSEATG